MPTTLAEAFSELPYETQVEIIKTHIGNQLFSLIAEIDPEFTEEGAKEIDAKLKELESSDLLLSLPPKEKAHALKLCQDARNLAAPEEDED